MTTQSVEEDEWTEAARVVIRELRAKGYAIEQGWRTIDSAPRDGTAILIGTMEDEAQETAAVSTLGWWQDAEDDGPDYMGTDGGFVDHAFSEFYPGRSFGNPTYQRSGSQPTHWRPLMAPPKAGE
tara:strand:- start:14761 stop:15135 length:375 start_codon:yes stop_codon:yes gene_type:complete